MAPLRWALASLATLACGIVPFAAAAAGYGAYVRYAWPLAVVGLAVAALLAAWEWRLRARHGLYFLILVELVFLTGWAGGVLRREVHCQCVRARCEPLLAALRRHRAEHGEFPSRLDQVPLEDGEYSFHDLALRWMLGIGLSTQHAAAGQPSGPDRKSPPEIVVKFFDYLEANAIEI